MEIAKVNVIPSKIIRHTTAVETRLLVTDPLVTTIVPLKNTVAIVIRKGNLPLQGTKQFVRIAISLSLLDAIILQPVTPAALQPNPIHIVKACFPEEPHFLKHLSKLKAIRGKYPRSSKSVNSGKNIAIGGSITLVIHVTVL